MEAPTAAMKGEWKGIGSRHRSLNDVVADALREAILSGQFKPGDRLPEPQLAEMFGVSRNPIREALHILSHEGLIEINRRKGARVQMMSYEEVAETIELRAELEGLGARNAARHCDGALKAKLSALLDAGNAAHETQNLDELRVLNNRFHLELADAGRNRYLAEFVRTLRDRTYWLFSAKSYERALESWTEHANVLKAVIAGDEQKAAILATAHVKGIGDALLADMAARAAAEA